MRCPWLHRKSLAEKGNETVSEIQGNLWGLLSFTSFQPSFPLTDMKIRMCWCKPASNPGGIVLIKQASRTISNVNTAEMHHYRRLKPRSIFVLREVLRCTRVGGHAFSRGSDWRHQEAPSHLHNSASFWTHVCSLVWSQSLKSSSCTDQVL